MAEVRDDFQDDDLYDAEEDTLKDKYLTFHLAGEGYGLDIAFVTEIIGIQKITGVPDMPNFVKGVINLRGKVIPVMDVRLRFHLPERDYDERTCIVVVDIKSNAVGLVVDQVNEVADIPGKDVEPPPRTTKEASSQFLKGLGKVGDQVRILLNVEMLLDNTEISVMAATAAA